MRSAVYDIAIVGGGINGAGVARDAAGRGLKVLLAEQSDLGSATSSASTKLIHGGLRYLEHHEFRLVRHALEERERLWAIAPHIIWPLRFVLPHRKGLRPAWLLRLGLFLYDHLGGRKLLPGTKTLRLRTHPAGEALRDVSAIGFEYSDCWVQDNRLVVLNARDAAMRGADIRVRTRCVAARRDGALWRLTLEDAETGRKSEATARALVNAAGPWADKVVSDVAGIGARGYVRLVQGSHIVVRKLYEHDRCYIFQNPDGRIFFAIPYEEDFTLIGTTDRDYKGAPEAVAASAEEVDYLLAAASSYFRTELSTADVVWTYSGVRALFDDGAANAQETTRDYVLQLDRPGAQAPMLSVFGGKITTYRCLAGDVLDKLATVFPDWSRQRGWTATQPLPGGAFPAGTADDLARAILDEHPYLTEREARRLVRHYGLEARDILGKAQDRLDLGRDFGGSMTEAEITFLMEREFALTAADAVWRRTKSGLRMTSEEIEALDRYMRERRGAGATSRAAG
ncbi:glycerol-3-phosphate dehydrogenase [Sinorhizobium meliloti]|uniref:glycerol-3-phosphate dehydrogenase n=1 Tax=Rhizobium meliloti TaxID=382 RepID=UPI001295C5C9|nr:glycerol-3-phosphate dehydrogenase [Sinorhizobium meliloti]MDW9593754.1 glycerol-3-phosphate dehydrogenase [Sinorhizobium meliloti]MDX0188826.1 glycerol-3-phosphate dehydrogenase [Sinorhizobium meliloti]MQV12033.1 glycerol-3-phosphate dehydrogenase [Sinorhizobium meliloti]MQV58790.1 glycerol-3-phosphate dehydrogenase [Sinorhizobium meliloti]